MPALSISQLQDKLNTRLGDATDRTYQSSEKTEFLNSAINDEYVFDIVRDDSITTVADQASYDISGTGVTDVIDVSIDIRGDGYPEPMARSAYDVVGDTLYFDGVYKGLPADKTLIILGRGKLTTTDTIPEFLQEYVLTLAHIEALMELATTYTTRFLKNDVTLSEIIAQKRELEAKANRLRVTLRNRHSVRD